MPERTLIGLDVGSTTVKAMVKTMDGEVLWKDYQHHETHQPEKVYEFLERIEEETGRDPAGYRIFATGSGSGTLTPSLGARFVQEVNAVSLAVRTSHPKVRSVVELGGQDAKIIVFKEDPETGQISTVPSMNDKCASGTGATIEKIAKKVGTPLRELGGKKYLPFADDLVHIAAKCGVFAETDVVGHLKSGLPEDQILASLFDSIVAQNLSVLTRGHTLRPQVLLLGGPNTYIDGMVEAWRHNIPKMWAERGVEVVGPIEEHVVVPDDAQYYAALGAIQFGLEEGEECIEGAAFRGREKLKYYMDVERHEQKAATGGQGLWETDEELETFLARYTKAPFQPAVFERGQVVQAFLGIDGGSTSSKAVLVGTDGEVLHKSYRLSDGNPIQDAIDCFGELKAHVTSFGATLEVLGVGTTGYAKDVLGEVIGADARVVETVSHTMAARALYPDVDVICDVGGQDIKLIMLQDGRVSDFRLNTQCSAGNGYFLQSTAAAFGVDVRQYAKTAFQARRMPSFGYGCAVFMQSDIVNFQKEGWSAEEIMAGLADVLPKNIWLYVSKIPNLASLGTTFVLQGGTQYNLAAVKAQVDFIQSRFRAKGVEVDIHVHDHCGEAGAIGCALEARRLHSHGRRTTWIGDDALLQIRYSKINDERTRCHFCKNDCARTFIDVEAPGAKPLAFESTVPLPEGHQRIITGFSCEKGTVESAEEMKAIKSGMDATMGANPNLIEEITKAAFEPVEVEPAIPRATGFPWFRWKGGRYYRRLDEKRMKRKEIRIGIPRVLNQYSLNPFFMGYFQSLGLHPSRIQFSPHTNADMYKEGAKRGSIDPCFPSKLCIPHVHWLLQKHKKRPYSAIFFPMIDTFPTFLRGVTGSKTCPTVCATPAAVKAAFTKEADLFAEAGVPYLSPLLNLDEPGVLGRQMLATFGEMLDLDAAENKLAVERGLEALQAFDRRFRERGRRLIEELQRDGRLGFVVLARPYHNDDGVNHEIILKLQRLGYPILSQESLPYDDDFLMPLFAEDLKVGRVRDPREIGDVWPTSYSENTSRKVWAAKVAARHPNLVALELSSFKCGHDAPPYTVIERILSTSKTPYFTFRDLDENDPGGAIKIRLETMDYFLKRELEKLKGATDTAEDELVQMAEPMQYRASKAEKSCAPVDPVYSQGEVESHWVPEGSRSEPAGDPPTLLMGRNAIEV